MVIEKQSSFSQKKQGKAKISLDLIHLNMFCKYAIQPSTLVRMEHLSNLFKLVNIIDPSTYENDPEKVKRMRFIYNALEARLKEGIHDQDAILSYVCGGITFKIDFLDYNNLNLNRRELEYISEFITESINFQFIYEHLDEFLDIITRFKTAEFTTKGPIVKEFEEWLDYMKSECRRNRIDDNITDMVFSLADGVFENVVTNVWNITKNPSRRLITGMQALNDMLGGGFESSRFYMIMGTSGIGKSLTLLNIIYQIKKYNVTYQTKDPSKKPAIVLLTMENSVIETVTRLFDLIVGNNTISGMENYDISEVLRIMREEGQLVLNESSPINIIVRYKPSRSVSTSYLYSLYDELEDLGYEMICLVEDHIKKIRSCNSIQDLRIELGEVVNEMKAFAVEKDIPVISNTHLNREATKLIEDAMLKKTSDVGRQLGKSFTGESLLMGDNMDCGISITLDFDQEGRRYMGVNLAKMRDKNKAQRTYFAQPFVEGSTIRLVEDYGGIPQYKDSLHTAPEMRVDTVIKTSGASSLIGEVKDLLKQGEDKDNIFELNSYTLSPEPEKPTELYKPIEFFEDMII